MTKSYHHGDLRAALLDAAEALVRERGVHGWSLRETSSRVGVSPSAAYHHFTSRDALVGALSARVLTELGHQLDVAVGRATVRSEDPAGGVSAWGCAYLSWALADPALARLAFAAPEDRPATTAHPHEVLSRELDDLVDRGHLPAGARPGADFVIWAAVHGLTMLVLDGRVSADSVADLRIHCDHVCRVGVAGLREKADAPAPMVSSVYTQRLEPAGDDQGRPER